MKRFLIATLVLIPLGVSGSAAWAEVTLTAPGDDATESDDWRHRSRQAAADGAYLSLTLAPAVTSRAGLAVGMGGYDGARGSGVMDAVAEARVYGPLAVRVGTSFSDTKNRLRPSVGARLQLLHQQRHGIDGAVAVFYKAEGLTEPEGEIEAVLSAGRRFGGTLVIANLAYGQDPEGNERDGEVRLAALHQLGDRLHAGIDGRWRFDLGSNEAKLEAANEPTFDLDAGPVVSFGVGPIALLAHGGVSVVRRVGGSASVGAVALGGVGSAF
jgi:hypothetical protein